MPPAFTHSILAVDDDPMILDIVEKFLSSKNLRVLRTTDPETALTVAQKEMPGLIISDIAMPGLSGLQLLRKIKENPATASIPFILLTSSRSGDDVREGLNSGAEAYLVKPIDWDIDWPKIQAILLRS
jgi:DNA-binding response OmpR family regulator